jgi:hypothetical protein
MRAHQLLRKLRRLSPAWSFEDLDTLKRLLPQFTIDELETLISLAESMIHESRNKSGDSRAAKVEFSRIVMGALRQEKLEKRRGLIS